MGSLEALLLYLIGTFPRQLRRTELVKLVYLFEHLHTLAFGHQYTSSKFIRYHYGPYSKEVVEAAEASAQITVAPYVGVNGPGYLYSLTNGLDWLDLPPQQRLLADFVVEVTSLRPFPEIIGLVYSTGPMVNILLKEEALNCSCLGEELDMAARKPVRKFTEAELSAAKQRVKRNREKRGSDEEYLAHLMEGFVAFERLRRRANEWEK